MRPWRMPPRRRRDARPTRRPYARVPKKKTGPDAWRQGPDETPDTAGDDDQIIARRDRLLLLTVAAAWLLFAPDWRYVWEFLTAM